jgi:hypothetical protein
MYRALLFILFLAFKSVSAADITSADSTKGSFAWSARMDYGFVIAHRPVLVPLQESHVKGFEISLSRLSAGNMPWEQDFLLPTKGITLAVFDLGNPTMLGTGVAIYPYIDFPFNKKTDSHFLFRYGIGLGWIEKTFDAETNIKNAAIGSHINGVIHFDLHYEKMLSARSQFELGAGITHFSNGAIKLPNLGMNIATVNLAFTHFIGAKKAIEHPIIQEDGGRKIEWCIYAAGGFKKIYPPEGKTYQAGVVSGQIDFPIKRKNSWGIGTDVFYDNSLQARLINSGAEKKGSTDNIRLGIYGAYEMHTGKTDLTFNMGFYGFSRWKEDGNVYHRIGVRQYFNRVFLCMNLKTHYARADFIEFGCGYKFK